MSPKDFLLKLKIFALVILPLTKIAGQNLHENLIFESFNEEISTRAISVITKDDKGIVWIGTQGDGLSSFNGYEFKQYKHDWDNVNTLDNSVVNSIFIDSYKNLWVGTQEGLNLYNRNLDHFIQIKLDSLDSKIPVKTINETDNKKLLIGTHGYGAFVLDIKSMKCQVVSTYFLENIKNFQINSIKITPRGATLIGTNKGLYKYNIQTNEIIPAKFTTLKGSETINSSIQSITTKKDGSIWLGTENNGLIEVFTNPTNYYEFKTYGITNKRILSLEIDKNGSLFCGTENDGLFIIDKKKNFHSLKHDKSNTKGIKSNSIWSIYVDEKNRIWVGYFNQGIDIYDKDKQRFKSIESIPNKDQSLFSNSVTAITQDKFGKLYFGIGDGGLDVYDPEKNNFTHLIDQSNPIAKGLISKDVVTVFTDSENNLWVGTWNSGFFYLENGSNNFKNVQIKNSKGVLKSNRIMSFAEDSKGNIWIGSFLSGLYSFNIKTKKLTHHQEKTLQDNYIDTKNIRKLIIDQNDDLWLGTRTGLFKISNINNNPKVKSYNSFLNESLNTKAEFNVITTLFEDHYKNIWIGTDGYGLCSIDPNDNSVNWYNNYESFIHQTIYSIVESDENNIWITGNNGISKYNTKSKTFKNYNIQDGLLANNFNKNSAYISDNNLIYFGCYKGINYFDPNSIIIDKDVPKVYLSDFKLSNKKVIPGEKNSPLVKVINETKSLKLKHDQSLFTIDFFGLSYTRSKNINYAYYLDGFEENWNYVGKNRSATYTNIPPGNYNFKVKAANSDGIWNNTPTVLNIVILPPWWKTNLATFLFFLTFITFIILFYRFLNLRFKEKLEIKREREERRQIEGLNAKKIQFFTNISHEFRTPLTLILNPLEDIIKNKSLILPEQISEKHKIIYKNSKRLSRLIDELMDFRKLQFNKIELNVSKFDLIGFIKEVASHFEEEAVQRNIKLSIDNETSEINIWADPSMLEKIIFNLLSNAFKATSKGGNVKLRIKQTNKTLIFPLINKKEKYHGIEISISDSGIGIKEENLDKIFSRFYQVNEFDKQYYGGTGIGLEVVKNFIDLHKGIINVKSKKNIGTKFTIILPKGNNHFKIKFEENELDLNSQKFKQINIIDNKNSLNIESKISKKTILIVEDNLELGKYLKSELIEEYRVKIAENGEQGLNKAIDFIPDLIISDVMMPIMDGFEFCEKIKSNKKTCHIPLLMLTAKGMQIDKIKGIEIGADAYVTKPFNMQVLKSQIKQLISSREILFNKYFKGIENTDLSLQTSRDKQFITSVLNYINDNINNPNLSVESLADELFLSRSKLYRKIKFLTGDTATEFIRKIKLEKAKELLNTTDLTVSEISYKVGFSSPSYFTKCFKLHFGKIPKEFRSKNYN